MHWIRTFYKHLQSCVANNGLSLNDFNLMRGVRQGDPVSPYLLQSVHITLRDVCVGIINSECPLLNYLLLIGKLYLWDCRRSNKLPNVGIKVKVDIKYQIEKYVCTKNNKFANFEWKWKR